MMRVGSRAAAMRPALRRGLCSMPPRLHVLCYAYVPDAETKRVPFRAAHLAHAKAAEEAGKLLIGGAFAPVDGAILAFASDEAFVNEFAKTDPYVTSGLVADWEVKVWTPVVGSLMPAVQEKA